jgi:hypothetical protein
MSWEGLFATFSQYFIGDGHMYDQAYQERIKDGTIRCYLVQDRIAGFGHQAINALHPTESKSGPRLYHPPTASEFQDIKQKMESDWLPELLGTLGMSLNELPMLWDADFMLGPKTAGGEDTYVLCEINVSSVYPYPADATLPLAQAMKAQIMIRRGS